MSKHSLSIKSDKKVGINTLFDALLIKHFRRKQGNSIPGVFLISGLLVTASALLLAKTTGFPIIWFYVWLSAMLMQSALVSKIRKLQILHMERSE